MEILGAELDIIFGAFQYYQLQEVFYPKKVIYIYEGIWFFGKVWCFGLFFCQICCYVYLMLCLCILVGVVV